MDYREFYAELGKLLYAVADADGTISPQERESLNELIRSRLAHREVHTDEYGTNDAWYAMFEFEVAEEQAMTPEEAFQSFSDFLDARRDEVDEDTRALCLTLADRLAESYHHTNRRESELIRKLKEKLFSLPDIRKNSNGGSSLR
ncbi:MAG: TerB family tellurite resistance protein [Chitinophagaceae bacterium]|jgi:uncharacterized tellurite resistance protein B-like protein|nr:TerB family tellurite resistance protein [Chitinophagaceae bacterium]